MKKWFKLYVCTLRKDLLSIVLIAIAFVFVMDIWLKNIPAPNNFFAAIGIFLYSISTAYISSFIFYFIVVHYNRQKEKTILYGHISKCFYIILNDSKDIFKDMTKAVGINVKFEDIKEEDIAQICSINPMDNSPVLEWENFSSHLNWLLYLYDKQQRVNEYSNKILLQMPYLEVELVDIINQFTQSDLFSNLNILVALYKEGRLQKKDFISDTKKFIKYYSLIKTSENYYNKEFKRYI